LKISVVIRTRDKERYFEQLLENLAFQTVQPSEIIVVNNYSTDEKKRILEQKLSRVHQRFFSEKKIKLKLITLFDNEFSHAYSTNLGVYAAENELVCITNAHSLPMSSRWLQDGTRHFKDQRVAGVSGFFVPHPEVNNLEKLNAILYNLSQKFVLRQDWCSTINCIIKKSLWKLYPFDENLPKIIPETKAYGLEDYDWSREIKARGFKIRIDSRFNVFHSHGNCLDEAARNIEGYFVYRRIQQKINMLERPRESFSRVLEKGKRISLAKVFI
jgi:glycosyltransferase involved in cell wall biosynthesis